LKCKLCHREAVEEGLCEYHLLALKNLKEAYPRWKEAYGGMKWEEYLKRLLELEETGEWVKDVVRMLLDQKSYLPR